MHQIDPLSTRKVTEVGIQLIDNDQFIKLIIEDKLSFNFVKINGFNKLNKPFSHLKNSILLV